MAVTPLLILAVCEDAETCWLVEKKMTFHVALQRKHFGSVQFLCHKLIGLLVVLFQ